MRNRRDFMKTVAGATAGAFVMSGSLADLSAQGRGGGGGAQGRGAVSSWPLPVPVRHRDTSCIDT